MLSLIKFVASIFGTVRQSWTSITSLRALRPAKSAAVTRTTPVESTPLKSILVKLSTSMTVNIDVQESSISHQLPSADISSPSRSRKGMRMLPARPKNCMLSPKTPTRLPRYLSCSKSLPGHIEALAIPDDKSVQGLQDATIASIRDSFTRQSDFIPKSPPSPTPSDSSTTSSYSSESTTPPTTPPATSFDIPDPIIHISRGQNNEDLDITDEYYRNGFHSNGIVEEDQIQHSILAASAIITNSTSPNSFRPLPIRVPSAAEKMRIQQQLAKSSQPRPRSASRSGDFDPKCDEELKKKARRISGTLRPLLLPMVVEAKRESVEWGKGLKGKGRRISCMGGAPGLGLSLAKVEMGYHQQLERRKENDRDFGDWDEEAFIGMYVL